MLNSTHSPFFNVGQLEVDLLWAIFASKFFGETSTESSSVSVRSPALLLLVHRVEEGALQDQERAKREPSHQLGNYLCLQKFSCKSWCLMYLPLWKQWGIPQSHPCRRHSSNPQLERKYESEHLILRSAGEKYHRVHRPMLSQIPLREVCQAFSRLVVPSTAETPMILESEVSKARSSLDVASSSSAFGSATESAESGSCREEATWLSLRKEARSRLSREGCTFSTEALFTWCPSSPRSRTEARHRIGNLMSSRSESCDWMLEDTDRDTSSADTGRRV